MAAVLNHRTWGRKVYPMGASFCIARLQSSGLSRQVGVSTPREHTQTEHSPCCLSSCALSTWAHLERLCAHHSHNTPNSQKNQSLEPGTHLTEGLCCKVWAFGKLRISVCIDPCFKVSQSHHQHQQIYLAINQRFQSCWCHSCHKSSKWDHTSDFPLLPGVSINI